ncbi:MAG TPA: type II toxin-antitoxin system prevent-host-death family antitoxin [Spirochaetia bacterium]|nr:type II toxin-antitoxin system prevent-host-death family antitoxin [Spirochaetia bacterium]
MALIISMDKANHDFLKIIEKVRNGEEVILEDNGNPIINIFPYRKKKNKRVANLAKDKIWISEDFDQPLSDDIIKDFYQ